MTKRYLCFQIHQSFRCLRHLRILLLSLLALMDLSHPATARDFTCNGIVYTVLDEEAHTCSTKPGVFNPTDSTVTPGNIVKGNTPVTIYLG